MRLLSIDLKEVKFCMNILDMEKKLLETRKLSTEKDIKIFENTIEKICSYKKPEYIISLCKGFCDDTEDYEVMYGLVHAIENLGADNYLYWTFFGMINMKEAKEWSKIFMYGMLNDEIEFNRCPDLIKKMPQDNRIYIFDVLNEIKNEDNEMFGERIDMILKQYKE